MKAVENTKLVRHLGKLDDAYRTRLLELRETVSAWLAYIPATFPHYTQHGVRHGDEIVRQLSDLLFAQKAKQPSVTFSAVELYALCAAAYLHDAGMVTSDARKVEILASEEWTEWCESTGGVVERLARIEDLRISDEPENPDVANFLADSQLRFLLAEFVRRKHHRASAALVTSKQPELSRFGFDDPSLIATIAALCEGHGLDRQDLEDNTRYPQRRSIRGEMVNVRFLAVLLRLGDLLDMSVDRACPLLQVAACPLPSDSIAHWSQYQRITHKLVAPDRIEVQAECENQEEHRYLVDWCDWLVAEARNAGAVMARAERHDDWTPPVATVSGSEPTIRIAPDEQATYIPWDWTMELDQDFVFRRLIFDAYGEDISFVRELVQNAADASRCRALAEADEWDCQSPTDLPKELRDEFAITVGMRQERVYNERSQRDEERAVFYIEDRGIGMDAETIERFFLQVGRSFYGSKSFKERYVFSPSSRFGLGFLSVFAVSDRVTVETKHHAPGGEALRMILTGPRSYLLTETGALAEPGTRIEVQLREPIAAAEIEGAIRKWCRRLEFPVRFEAGGGTQVIEAESAEALLAPPVVLSGEHGEVATRTYPFRGDRIEGDLFQFVRVLPDGSESWADSAGALYPHTRRHPDAVHPEIPMSLLCVAGITVSEPSIQLTPGPARIDYRKPVKELSLSREPSLETVAGLLMSASIESRWIELLREHLAATSLTEGERGWVYKQELMSRYPFAEVWLSEPGTVPVERAGETRLLPLERAVELDVLATLVHPDELTHGPPDAEPAELLWDTDADGIGPVTRRALSDFALVRLLGSRTIADVRTTASGHLQVLWVKDESILTFRSVSHQLDLLSFGSEETIGFPVEPTLGRRRNRGVLNSDHRFVQWLMAVLAETEDADEGVSPVAKERLLKAVDSAIFYPLGGHEGLATLVGGWNQMEGLPEALRLPDGLEITVEAFRPWVQQ